MRKIIHSNAYDDAFNTCNRLLKKGNVQVIHLNSYIFKFICNIFNANVIHVFIY